MLKDQILSDLKLSLKEGNEIRTGTIRLLLSAIQNKEIEKRSSDPGLLSDDEVLDLILREVKKRKEASELYLKGGRDELARKEESEMKELEKYLPPRLSESEIADIVKKAIEIARPSSPKDIGRVMGLVMKQAKGRADSGLLSELIKKTLENPV